MTTLSLTCGLILIIALCLTGLIAYCTRAGRNSARVKNDTHSLEEAHDVASQEHRMNEAQTDGIRSTTQLLNIFRKGSF